MNHKKVHSQGNIPFSWEDKPGISKSSNVIIHYDHHHYCLIDVGPSKVSANDKKDPPPPPFLKQSLPKRSSSVRGWRWWPQDPFLATYKECTKSGGKDKLSSENGGSKFVWKKKKITFSCKESSDVSDDNLVRLSNFPPLPKDGTRRRQEFVYPLQESF